MSDTNTIVEKLKAIKKEQKLTLEQISERSGVPMGTVSRVFGNVHYDFKYETIKPIAKALIGFDDLDDPEVENPVADNQIIRYCT